MVCIREESIARYCIKQLWRHSLADGLAFAQGRWGASVETMSSRPALFA